QRSVSPSRTRSPIVGPCRSAWSFLEMRSGTRRAPELHEVDVAGLARRPSQRIPGEQVQPEPARGIAVERKLRVRLVEREVRGDADRAFRGVGDGEPDARSLRSERDVALPGSRGAGS